MILPISVSRLLFTSGLLHAAGALCSVSADTGSDDGAITDTPNIPERIQVTARIPDYQQTLSQVLPQQPIVDDTSFSSDSLATMLSQAPAVNLNGQGGLFQTINIRGFARWRIQTLVEGIPIYTDRRAGTSVEFLPPSFLGQAYLTQGAASTQLGSGAMGGGIDLYLAEPEHNQIQLRYGPMQDYREVQLQGRVAESFVADWLPATDTLSWQANHRHSNNSEDGDGNAIQDKFEQHSLALRQRSDTGALRETTMLYSSANNIAKASADDPAQRFTVYPDNTHLLGKLQFAWHNATLYWHDARLHTVVTRPEQRTNSTVNESFDFGASVHDEFLYRHWQVHWRAGVDARSGVTAFEQELDSLGQQVFARHNLDARQWESYVAFDFAQQSKQTSNFDQVQFKQTGAWVGGARLAYQHQQNQLDASVAAQTNEQPNVAQKQSQHDTNVSAFLGYGYALSPVWQLSGYVSSAYRVPSLTERYFNGATPRGTVLGDANLNTETAINIEANVQYQGDNMSASLAIFQQRIDDYIERIRINDELRQYRNLDQADIHGVNYQLQYQFNSGPIDWQINLGGQWLNGEDNAGNAVADISPAQHRLGLQFNGPSFWSWLIKPNHNASQANANGYIAITHRQASSEQVSGELPTSSVTTIDAGYHYEASEQLTLSLNIHNLTNRTYVTSRDDLAPFAKGRDVQLSVQYRLY